MPLVNNVLLFSFGVPLLDPQSHHHDVSTLYKDCPYFTIMKSV